MNHDTKEKIEMYIKSLLEKVKLDAYNTGDDSAFGYILACQDILEFIEEVYK